MAKITPVVYPALPTKIGEINIDYIKAYLTGEYKNGNLSVKKVKEVNAARKQAQKESGGRYFITYRKEFCRICFPNLYNPVKGTTDWDDFFKNLLGEEA